VKLKKISKVGVRVTVGLASAVLVAFAFGYVQSRITVESRDGRRNSRRFDNYSVSRGRDVRVRLVRRLSDAPCVEGRSWGYNQNEIWVDRGCRAEFEVIASGRRDDDWRNDDRRNDGRHDRRNGGRWGNGRWGDQNGIRREIRVESSNGRRGYVRVDTTGGVRLIRRLSDAPCVEGRTWGYDRDGIWTSRGCRAIFEVNTYAGRRRG
jgi:hypothetical protein